MNSVLLQVERPSANLEAMLRPKRATEEADEKAMADAVVTTPAKGGGDGECKWEEASSAAASDEGKAEP